MAKLLLGRVLFRVVAHYFRRKYEVDSRRTSSRRKVVLVLRRRPTIHWLSVSVALDCSWLLVDIDERFQK